MNAFDAIVIGAGADERVAALLLARAGRRVLLVDERPDPQSEGIEFRRGWVPAPLAGDLDLATHGLIVRQPEPWANAPLPAGGALELSSDMRTSVASIRAHSPRDAGRWPGFCERMKRLADILAPMCTAPAPDPLSRSAGELLRMGAAALRARGLGRRTIEDLLRLLPMPVADLLDEEFESDALKGVLGAAGVAHLRHGPRAGGTALRLLLAHLGNPPGVFRAPLSNLEPVLARLVASHPAIESRRGAVASIRVAGGSVTGVALAGGEQFGAASVASGADPTRTLLEWSDPAWLDPELGRAIRNIRRRGVAARMLMRLERPPGFEALTIAPSLAYLERAADDAKYGRASREPLLEAVVIPHASGSPVLELHLQYAPYRLAQGSWDEAQRSALREQAVALMSQALPAFESLVRECTVYAPTDLDRLYGWPEGQAHHAESTLDQMLWMRPVPALAGCRTPIRGLYLCGPAMHPGGGIAGAAGRNAARVMLADARGKRP